MTNQKQRSLQTFIAIVYRPDSDKIDIQKIEAESYEVAYKYAAENVQQLYDVIILTRKQFAKLVKKINRFVWNV